MKDKVFAKIKKHTAELISLVTFLLFILVGGTYISSKLFALGFLFLVLYVAFVILACFMTGRRRRERDKEAELLTNVTVELLMEMKMPVAILDSLGVVVWYNQSFADKSDDKTLYGTNINDLLQTRLNINRLKVKLSSKEDGEKLIASYSGTTYQVDSYPIKSGSEEFYITVWDDMTELEELSNKLERTNPVVAYIYVDNAAETSVQMNSDYRTVTAKISGILHEWVGSMNGILREFDREQYIAVFDNSHIETIVENRCDILDKVREASENTDLTVSVSMGIASLTDASFYEKEKIAHQAIDLAMQRGGDQAVIRFDSTTELFGGRLKTVQKRTKSVSRVRANELVTSIKESSNVLVMGHRFPDHDSVGACVGVAALAMMYTDKVNIIINNKTDSNIKALVEKVETLPKYANTFIDSVSAQDLVGHNTLLIICDVNNSAIFESPEVYENVKRVAIIDHHRKTGEFLVDLQVSFIDPSASSASELVSEMLEFVTPPGTLLKEEADALFAGIVLDTKHFSKNTGMRTFMAAHYLRSESANPAEVDKFFKTSIEDFTSEARFETNVVIYRDIIAISMLEGEASASDKVCASKAADRLLGLDGVLASFALCKIDNTVYISARSLGTVNVQLILEKLNGGGHFDAAGAQVSGDSVTFVLESLRAAIDEYLDSMEKKG